MSATYPNLTDEVLEHFLAQGFKKYCCSFYSTKEDDLLIRVIDKAIIHVIGTNSARGLVNYDNRIDVLAPEIQGNFVKGDYVLSKRSSTRPMEGAYFYIAKPIRSDSEHEASQAFEDVATCAAFISLFHGETVAAEPHFSGIYDIQNNSVAVKPVAFYVRNSKDTERLDQKMAVIIDEDTEWEFEAKPTCLSLIRRAHHENDASIKFLFMWLALEAAIGGGIERKKFALQTMKSDHLNEIINGLRDKRSSLVHDGKLVGFTHFENLQLKCIITMGLARSEPLRARLLAFLVSDLVA